VYARSRRHAVASFSDFLDQHVEGYLFKDIESLMAVPVPPDGGPGGVGYPLVMTLLSGIELLGIFVDAEQNPQGSFDTGSGSLCFDTYWKRMLYPKFADLGIPVYKLARHGLMHAFTTKGPLAVSKTSALRNQHLTKASSGTIHINCNQFTDDFRHSYDYGFKPLALNNLERMEARLQDLTEQYNKQGAGILKDAKFPASPATAPADVSLSRGLGYTQTAVTSSLIK
jgi:hypothetical protein